MSSAAQQRATFFRQSGWLMLANLVGGALMYGVHFLSKAIPTEEYGTVGKLLAATIIIPAIPLQMVFAREAAAALALGQTGRLASVTRKTLLALFALWLPLLVAVLTFQADILAAWKISDPVTLWLFLGVALASLVSPVFMGLLQGQQNFLWLGWAMMLSAAGRLGLGALLVLVFLPTATGVMAGVLFGVAVALAPAIWQTRALWGGPGEAFAPSAVVKQMVPLMLGFGACQFLFSADPIFVGRLFSAEEAGYYTAAGTLSRALMWLVLPLASVMFPKLVHSAARAEKSNLLGLTLLATGVLAVLGAAMLVLLAPIAVRIPFPPHYVGPVTALLAPYAFAMVPLSMAFVLVNNLLAKSDFRVVPVVVVVALGYGLTLALWHPSLRAVPLTMAGFTTLLLAVCALFTWGPLARGAGGTADSQPPSSSL